jgi:hypothetical protein
LLQCGGRRGRENVAGSSRLKESKFAAKERKQIVGICVRVKKTTKKKQKQNKQNKNKKEKGSNSVLSLLKFSRTLFCGHGNLCVVFVVVHESR